MLSSDFTRVLIDCLVPNNSVDRILCRAPYVPGLRPAPGLFVCLPAACSHKYTYTHTQRLSLFILGLDSPSHSSHLGLGATLVRRSVPLTGWGGQGRDTGESQYSVISLEDSQGTPTWLGFTNGLVHSLII